MATDIGTRSFWQSPPRAAPAEAETSRDDLDDLFNYDAEPDQNAVTNVTTNAMRTTSTRDEIGAGDLGIDEEIKVRKPRAPIAKLDEDRLLSANGIPKLRGICKDRLRFKGKGHEFSDVARLLNTYQLWLDDLFPKAKFADGLSIIEKLGHKKRMQVYRREWINESKPKSTVEEASEDDGFVDGARHEADQDVRRDTRDMPEEESIVEDTNRDRTSIEEEEDDLYAEAPLRPSGKDKVTPDTRNHDEPEEDELDALLAEHDPTQAIQGARQGTKPPPPSTRDTFADEEEAMAGMDFEW